MLRACECYLIHSHLQEEETEAIRTDKKLPLSRAEPRPKPWWVRTSSQHPLATGLSDIKRGRCQSKLEKRHWVWGRTMQRPQFSFPCEVRKDLLASPTRAWRQLAIRGRISVTRQKDTSELVTGLTERELARNTFFGLFFQFKYN